MADTYTSTSDTITILGKVAKQYREMEARHAQEHQERGMGEWGRREQHSDHLVCGWCGWCEGGCT